MDQTASRSEEAKNREREENDKIAYLLESKVWELTIRRMFKEHLDRMKKALLMNKNLTERDRYAFIESRQLIMEALQSQYRYHKVELPEWLEE